MNRFDILTEEEKQAFSDALDWHRHYSRLRCGDHLKAANLNLLVNRSGLNVSVSACCEDFFLRIVERKRKLRRLDRNDLPELE